MAHDACNLPLSPPWELIKDVIEKYENGRLIDAGKLALSISQKFPNDQFAFKILSAVLKQAGRNEEALYYSRKSVQLAPKDAEAHYNSGVLLTELVRSHEARVAFRRAIILKPAFSEAINNLGNRSQELQKLEAAEALYRKAIFVKPVFSLAHNNLGNTLLKLGKLWESKNSFIQAISLNPDYTEAWTNIGFTLRCLGIWQGVNDALGLDLKDNLNTDRSKVALAILKYRTALGTVAAEDSLQAVFKELSKIDKMTVKNPHTQSYSRKKNEFNAPGKIVSLVHFGRSGTGLLHSLIDGHPQLSTLPSIYFSEFFDYSTWDSIASDGWENMVDNFIKIYGVFFDAADRRPVPTKSDHFIHEIGRKEGMTTLGDKRDQVLRLDKAAFRSELRRLMSNCDKITPLGFFKLIHQANNKVISDNHKKSLIFYHIHNPDFYAQLNFVHSSPNSSWIMMVREPIQSCESWVRLPFMNNEYDAVVIRILHMLFEIDNVLYHKQGLVGVRLEDLKEVPEKTLTALCDWLGINVTASLYEMTAQGKRWWGDPSSQDYALDGMNPFGKLSLQRKTGVIFSDKDSFILRTLFYPFSVRFGYVGEAPERFKMDLETVRPMLDELFDFEETLIARTGADPARFIKSGFYIYLRAGLVQRWNTLKEYGTYPGMINPLPT